MKDIRLWVAEDGTRFDTDVECVEYEFNQLANKIKESGMKFWNKDKEEIILKCGNMDEIYFILCPNENAISLWEIMANDFWPFETCNITQPDFYWYNDEIDCWISLKRAYDTLKEMENFFGLKA